MLISVIIPVYNVEAYLRQCIDSVLAQTFRDFELLLIDDGSTDGSGAICDSYAAIDPRVRVFHKENGGVSSARNRGIDNAKGEWITFVDSDDYIQKEYLYNFILNIDEDLDLIIQGIRRFGELDNRIVYSYKENLAINIKDFLNAYNIHPNIAGPVSKFYKKRIIKNNKIEFVDYLKYGEDTIFNLDYISHTKYVKLITGTFYNYRDNSKGLSKKSLNYKDELQLYKMIKDRLLRLGTNNLRHYSFIANRVLHSIFDDANTLHKYHTMKYFVRNNAAEILSMYKGAKGRGYLISFCIKVGIYRCLFLIFKNIYR